MFQDFINEFIILFVAIDPVGTVPLLATVTRSMDEVSRRKLVVRGVVIAAGVLFGFAIFGQMLLHAMGISFASFRIAGGIILFLVGLQMVFQAHTEEFKHNPAEYGGRDLAVFPIAMPYIAGPGAILGVMVVMRETPGSTTNFFVKCLILVLVMVVTMVTLLFTSRLHKVLGRTGGEVIARVMGMLLAALAAESVVHGVLEALGRGSV